MHRPSALFPSRRLKPLASARALLAPLLRGATVLLPILLGSTVLLAAASLPLAAAETPVAGAPVAAPDFTLPLADGRNVRLADHRGEVVLINFWASWCGPCRVELPKLEALYTQYRDLGVTFLAINVDQERSAADRLLKDMKLAMPVLFDSDNKLAGIYGVDAMPSTVLVDRDGKLRHLHRGYKPGYEQRYEEQIRALLRE